MITKNEIKFIQSLKLRKYRQKYNKFIVEGQKSCHEFLTHNKYLCDRIFAQASWIENQTTSLGIDDLNIQEVTLQEMKSISQLVTPTDVLLVSHIKEEIVNFKLINRVVFLENVQDPGNMGAIVRIADWYDIDLLVLSPDSVDLYHPKVVQASMGSMNGVTILSMPLSELRSSLPDAVLIGTAMSGSALSEFRFPEKSILIMGNEGKGMTPGTTELCDLQITINGSSTRVAESLNVAMATSICCHAWSKNLLK